MCSGLRDAANLAWKLALVCKYRVDPALLDTYQTEREPHVRYIIEKAIEMGRIVCTLDGEVARARDEQMLRGGSGGVSIAMPSLPGIVGGFVSATPMAGELIPQPRAHLANGREGRVDDLMGHEFWLISRRTIGESLPHLKAVQLGVDLFDDGTIDNWLRKADAEAALIRPDRYVYGTGSQAALVHSLRALLANAMSAETVCVAEPA
jgi:3-(3-hydroxy-phenyl)propionate hydroxylase